MQEIKNASITVNLSKGSFTISGTEEFIEKNKTDVFDFIEKNKGKIELLQAKPTYKQIPQVDVNADIENSSALRTESDVDKYIKLGVCHIDSEDGSISILKKIPGNNDSTKMKNIAMIVLYIKKVK